MKKCLLSAISITLWVSCSMKPVAPVQSISITEVTEETTVSGIYSNIRGNVQYRVKLSGHADNVLFHYLEVDSIKLYPETVTTGNPQSPLKPGTPISMGGVEVEVKFVRMLYNDDGPIVSEEIVYEKSGLNHQKGGRLIGTEDGRPFALQFDKINALPVRNSP